MNKRLLQFTSFLFCFTTLLFILLAFNQSVFAKQQPLELSIEKKDEPDYFPLAVGNRWEYESLNPPGFSRTRIVIGTKKIDSKVYYEIESWLWGHFTGIYFYRKDKENNVWKWGKEGESLVYKLSAKEDESWKGNTPTGEITVTKLESRKTVLETPAGRFENCLKFSFNLSPPPPDTGGSTVLAPGVGAVGTFPSQGLWHVLKKVTLAPTDVKSNGKFLTTFGQLKR